MTICLRAVILILENTIQVDIILKGGHKNMKNKIMFIIVALFSIMLLVPHKVSAETAYPTVTNDTKADTLVEGTGDIKVEGSGTNAVTVTVNAGEFKLLEGGASQAGAVDSTRPAGYAWIGLHFAFRYNSLFYWYCSFSAL